MTRLVLSAGALVCLAGSAYAQVDPNQVAILRWYQANQSGATFSVGFNPNGIAFDGANIWVTNNGDRTVSKLRANDGTSLGAFSVGTAPEGVVFDGANIWVANDVDGTVMKLRATDGAILLTVTVGNFPVGLAFDGANIWVANNHDNDVMKLRAARRR